MSEWGCRICGKGYERDSAFGRIKVDHSGCDQDWRRWYDIATQIRNGPGLNAADAAVEAATEARDKIYRELMAKAGIPDWFAEDRVDSQYES